MPTQDQGHQIYSMDERGLLEPSPLTEELLVVDRYRRRVRTPVQSFPCTSGCPHSQTHVGSTTWTQWVIKKEEVMKFEEEML